MATADQPSMQLYYRLKKEFPEIPDNVISACMNRFPNDLQNCMLYLMQQRAKHLYGPMSELSIAKQEKDHYNHYETSHGVYYMTPGQQSPMLNRNNAATANVINNNNAGSGDGFPNSRYMVQKSIPYDAYYTRQPGLRSVSVSSGMPTAPRGQFHLPTSLPRTGQPQSAPVMPLGYEPQYPYYAKMSVSPSTVTWSKDPSMDARRNYYNRQYELSLSYKEGMSTSGGSYSLSSSSSIRHHHPHHPQHKVQAYINTRPRVQGQSQVQFPVPRARHVTSLNISPVGPHVGLYRFEPRFSVVSAYPVQHPVHSTTVNLRLQPPSSQPQPKVQINTSGGGSVVYSANLGQMPVKSHFHISFCPSGGASFASMRTRMQSEGSAIPQPAITSVVPPSPLVNPTSSPSCTSLSFCGSTSSSYSTASIVSGSVTVSTSSLRCDRTSGRGNGEMTGIPRRQTATATVTLFNSRRDSEGGWSMRSQAPLEFERFEVASKPVDNRKMTVTSMASMMPSRVDGNCIGGMTYVQALVIHQRAQLEHLKQKLQSEKQMLDNARAEVSSLELKLYNRIKALKHPVIFQPDEIRILREETRKLRVECDCLSREFDFWDKGQRNASGEAFYSHINPGQSGSIGTPPPPNRTPSRISSGEAFYSHINPGQPGSIGTPPPLNRTQSRPAAPPPPPLPHASPAHQYQQRVQQLQLQHQHQQQQQQRQQQQQQHGENRVNVGEEEGHQWSCSTCTFLNNPALDKCEICEMPRLMLASGGFG